MNRISYERDCAGATRCQSTPAYPALSCKNCNQSLIAYNPRMQTMIEHRSLCELAAKPSTRTALVSSQAGWVIHARTGKRSAVLIAERSQAPRVFRKMETATQYLRDLGITRFVVEADPSIEPAVPAQRRRPDRSRALQDRKSTRLNSSHPRLSRMPSSA